MKPTARLATALGVLLPAMLVGQGSFVIDDQLIGDPTISYGSIEFTADFQYMVWGEYAADGSDNMAMWHCGVDADTGDLIPPDGRGLRAFESTGWGRANTPGRDVLGNYYCGLDRSGRLVLVRPDGPYAGLVEVLPAPVDFTRRGICGVELPADSPRLGYVFWIRNSEGVVGGPGNPGVQNVQLRYLALEAPSVEHTLQDQPRPPFAYAFAPLDIAFPRNLRSTALLTSGARVEGVVQIVEFNLFDTPPQQRLVTTDPVTKSDAFGWQLGDTQVLMSGVDSTAGATQIYTRPIGGQYFTPVEVITPRTDNLQGPLFAQSNEHLAFEGRGYTAFQVNSRASEFFGTTFQQPGEIWLATVLQSPQQQWRLNEPSPGVARFEPEPFIGRTRAWVFYNAMPAGASLRTDIIRLRRAATPLVRTSTTGTAFLAVY